MSKFITLTQAGLDGQEEPKVLEFGKVTINVDSIQLFHHCIDKYNCIIKGVVQIGMKTGHMLMVRADHDELVERLNTLEFES